MVNELQVVFVCKECKYDKPYKPKYFIWDIFENHNDEQNAELITFLRMHGLQGEWRELSRFKKTKLYKKMIVDKL